MREKFAATENLKFNFLPDLHKIRCPVWYVAGECDPGHPYQGAEQAAAKIPNVKLDILKGLGGPVYLDDPEGVKLLATCFIKRILSSLAGSL